MACFIVVAKEIFIALLFNVFGSRYDRYDLSPFWPSSDWIYSFELGRFAGAIGSLEVV